jgi:hypothetical protein
VTTAQKSHLAAMGIYHYWINHSIEYSHTKFPFVKTANIEYHWAMLKKAAHGVFSSRNEKKINDFLNYFSLKCQIREDKFVDFCYATLRKKFADAQ